MAERTAAERYLNGRRQADSDYAREYELAHRRIEMFDSVIQELDAQREALGLTKADLARLANLPAAGVRRLFSQQQKNPTLTTIVAIADALGLQFKFTRTSASRSLNQRQTTASVSRGSDRTSDTRRRSA
jgi:DNA-binding phage protein